MNFQKAYLAAVLAPFFIAVSIIITKTAGTSAHPLVIAGIGSLMAVPFLLAIAATSRKSLDFGKILNELRSPFLQVLVTRALIGQALIVTGFTLTTGVKAVLLLRLEPIFVFAWSVLLLNEKPQRAKMLLLAILLVGSAMVVAPEGRFDSINVGDGLIVLSLVFLSFSYLPTQKVVAGANPAGLNILTSLISGALLTVIAAVWYQGAAFALSLQTYGFILGYAVIFSVIAVSLYFYAFKMLRPWVIASFLSLEVVFGLALATFFLHESINMMQFGGAVILMAATAAIGRLPEEGHPVEQSAVAPATCAGETEGINPKASIL